MVTGKLAMKAEVSTELQLQTKPTNSIAEWSKSQERSLSHTLSRMSREQRLAVSDTLSWLCVGFLLPFAAVTVTVS